MTRNGITIHRETNETTIHLEWGLDGNGTHTINTGIGFFDHMLTLFCVHGLFDMQLTVTGDLHVDAHHTVEDVGICLGQAIHQSLNDRAGIVRYASGAYPMDDTLCRMAIDMGGRPFLKLENTITPQSFGAFHTELVTEFFQALVQHAGMNLYVEWPHKGNGHHMIEALFKGAGITLDQATQLNPRRRGIPSSKGHL